MYGFNPEISRSILTRSQFLRPFKSFFLENNPWSEQNGRQNYSGRGFCPCLAANIRPSDFRRPTYLRSRSPTHTPASSRWDPHWPLTHRQLAPTNSPSSLLHHHTHVQTYSILASPGSKNEGSHRREHTQRVLHKSIIALVVVIDIVSLTAHLTAPYDHYMPLAPPLSLSNSSNSRFLDNVIVYFR